MSQNLRLLVSSVTLIILGILVDHFVISKTLAEKSSVPPAAERFTPDAHELARLKEKLSSITEADFRGYLNGQTAEEKLRKADEILAKIVKIYISDFGLHLTQKEIEKLGQMPPPQGP